MKNTKSFFRNRMVQANIFLLVVLTIWWLLIKPFDSEAIVDIKNLWSVTYFLISLFGGVFGLIIAQYWGGYKSLIGKAIICFSLGLFLQSFGQVAYNYYTLFIHIATPYPSVGDIGYFGSILAYIFGVLFLGRAAGIRFSLKSLHNKILAILLPILILLLSYLFFLRDYQFDWTSPLTIFLDFGYPFGQAVYVSLALLVFFASREFLGGIMKKPVLLLLSALIVQYICDFNFLYLANHGNWYPGNWGDYLYAVSYFIMTMSIIYMGFVFEKIKNS